LTQREALAAECKNGVEADKAFKERYCAPDRVGAAGTITRLAGVPVAVARCVLSKLTEFLPNGDHATPGWSSAPLPLVTIGKMTKDGRVRSPRCGLFADDRKLFVWADERDVNRLTNKDGWACWRQGNNEKPSLLRFNMELGYRSCADNDGAIPEELADFLQKLSKDERLAKSVRNGGPVTPREAHAMCGHKLDEAADTPEASLRTKAGVGAEPKIVTRRSPAPRQRQLGLDDISERVAKAIQQQPPSMLRVLRSVAIDRMRTAVPRFNGTELDKLIMATGYPPAAQPHAIAADFFYVVAANLANAAGGRPNLQEFADAVVKVMYAGGCFKAEAPHILHVAPTDRQLAGWLANLEPAPAWSGRMRAFQSAAAEIAAGRPVNTTHASMIGGIVDVAHWLLANHQGSAATLHAAMTAAPNTAHDIVLGTINQIVGCRGHGVALAANLLKDSQVPGLAAMYDPRTISAVNAGWFAKADMHVIRFMAKISRDVPMHTNGRRQSLPIARGSMVQPPVGEQGTPGRFPGHYADLPNASPDLRVVADIHDWATACHTSALEIERVLYLTGARSVSITQQADDAAVVTANGYTMAEAAIDAALAAGIPRMS
jgi:hypothetical protein